jgi:hypothetical protein
LLEYDSHIHQGAGVETALNKLRSTPGRHDPKTIQALESLVSEAAGAQDVFEVLVGNITPGMIFVDDLYTHAGTLLVPKGFEVSQAFLERARNFGAGILQDKVRVTSGSHSVLKTVTAATA